MSRLKHIPHHATFESLEGRVYLSRVAIAGSILNIYGTTAADQISVAYKTIPVGDANLDGKISSADFSRVDSSLLFATAHPTWSNGDFNGDGVVNSKDLALLQANSPTPTSFVSGYIITDSGVATFYRNITHVNVVTIGGGVDTVTGNSQNTDYWVDSTDITNISPTEIANGQLHIVTAFYQPFTTSTVPLSLSGQNLADPTDTVLPATRYPTESLWNTNGPVSTDVAQGSTGDCYLISGFQALATANPQLLEDHIVDLGDGTYAVDFVKGTTHSIVRVDGDFSVPNGDKSASNVLWPLVAEKAFAFFRLGLNTYASLDSGTVLEPFTAFNVPATYFPVTAATGIGYLTNALANDQAVVFGTNSVIPSNIPIVELHSYTLVSTSVINGVPSVTLQNPWGSDGYFPGDPPDSNPGDGLVTISFSALTQASSWAVIANNPNTTGNIVNLAAGFAFFSEWNAHTLVASPLLYHRQVAHLPPVKVAPPRLAVIFHAATPRPKNVS